MKQGFTLLELSIVLVIIGLIIGGITVGQDLIRSAELNSIAKEYQAYQTAVHTYKLKYNDIPGDMNNAEDYWGQAHATDATCITTASTTTVTCNGDGDGILDVSTRSNEYYRFWQHLANSEVISGTFNGIAGTDADTSDIGTNVPASKLSGAGWSVSGSGRALSAAQFDLEWGNNYFIYGAEVASEPTGGAIMSPGELINLDEKIDDGQPTEGYVIAGGWNDECTDADDGTETANDLAVSFKLSDDTNQCSVYFRKAF